MIPGAPGRVNDDGSVTFELVAHGRTTLIAAHNDVIAVKVAGGTHWAGIGARAYQSPRTVVFRVSWCETTRTFRVEERLIEWEHKRREGK